ncbi:MAG: PepSY-associated TM helix domain-containing protein [Bacteroidota bacterium]
MGFKKTINKLHLWLGLTSGLLVFIIAITGCIYAFQEEIRNATEPYRFVQAKTAAFVPPSKLRSIAEKTLPGKHLHAILYAKKDQAAKAIFYGKDYYDIIYMDPYSGKILKVSDENAGFFRIVLDGHFYLWLPEEIGQPLVASATLVFFVMVISGIILWWPRNKNARRQRFKIKWNASWKRRNYDLHSAFGFYTCFLALVFAITGLVWGFQWFGKGYYALISGGKSQLDYQEPFSEKGTLSAQSKDALDLVWVKMQQDYPGADWIEIHIPESDSAAIAANANPDAMTYWQTDYRYFDRYTLEEIPVNHMWGRSRDLSGADKLMRMNYDIHVGSVLGIPGKILAFSASLLIASMPVTGFLIWKGRRKKKR